MTSSILRTVLVVSKAYKFHLGTTFPGFGSWHFTEMAELVISSMPDKSHLPCLSTYRQIPRKD